ncbi:MAG: redoxin domain-containing protein [Victivallaceae bacterium]|jgi:tetratricopeptide (TPR) repeat protein|nr:redoxin domain-containing protein [Victivallaceae bacterium]NLK83677.1 redoxin domain-containing protein [Lentisphaerota bacterium]MDD3116676.1 redoxin domain-containing protein [Victivallaceae bacterium]MDD3704176.1 redoxin domain-containing protein [Victivallaceae bacterium]MDD4317367.1 redoxin domain-containing protein [Victivallaceae bacterium]
MRIISLLILLLAVMPLYAVRIDEKAPDLKVKKWLLGSTPDFLASKSELATSKKLTVVVCWGTWLTGPRDVTPVFDRLQREFGKSGMNTVFISGEPEDLVAAFIADRPGFSCRVGLDENELTLHAYLGNSRMFPRAFLIDPRGVVIWSGEAVDAESIIRLWFDGKFDSSKSVKLGKLYEDLEVMLRSRMNKDIEKKTDEILKLNPNDGFALRVRLFYYDVAKKTDEAIRFLDEYSQKNPDNLSIYLAAFNLLNRTDPIDADTVMKFAGRGRQSFQQNPDALQTIVETLLVSFPYLPGTLEFSAQIIEQIPQNNASALAVAALFYYKSGRPEIAVEKQRRAVSMMKQLEKTAASEMLKYYESALKMRQR